MIPMRIPNTKKNMWAFKVHTQPTATAEEQREDAADHMHRKTGPQNREPEPARVLAMVLAHGRSTAGALLREREKYRTQNTEQAANS